MKLGHLSVVSRSEHNAARFYEGVLGLEKIKEATLDAHLMEKIFSITSDCRIIVYANEHIAVEVFIPTAVQERKPTFEHICLEVEDMRKFLELCQVKGISVRRIPKGDRMLTFVDDFDGNIFEIKEQTR